MVSSQRVSPYLLDAGGNDRHAQPMAYMARAKVSVRRRRCPRPWRYRAKVNDSSEDMKKPNLVIYHANCADGFAAAWSAWMKLGGDAHYLPMSYDQSPPDVRGQRVFILDFSFKPEVMRNLDGQASEIVLLDHHKTAAERLSGFKCRCGRIHFDLGKCGARLAWEHFHATKVPPLIEYVEDRDLWRWQLPDSRAYLAALDAEEQTFENWLRVSQLEGRELAQFIARGQAMLDKAEAYARAILATALPVEIGGSRGLMVNAPQEFRDLGTRLAEKCGTFGAVWSQIDSRQAKVSLRSVPPFQCVDLATRFGGGGHAYAASFYLSLERVPQLMAGRLAE